MSKCYVGSEIGQLRRVILHRPELSLERLTPSNCEGLLFDDVLRVEKAGKEHDYFAQVLRDNQVEVLLLRNLLAETLENAEAKKWVLDRQCTKYRLGSTLAEELRSYLLTLSGIELAENLLGGITVSEFKNQYPSMTQAMKSIHDFIIPPLPNHLFTRDTSCWIYNGVSVNPMAKSARRRETVHLRAIYNFHPLFKNSRFDFWFGNQDYNYDHATLEGGDVLVIGKGHVLIGMGERSSSQGVECLAKNLFKQGKIKSVIAVELPKARSAMHMDTVMTMLDYDCFTIFPEVIQDDIRYWILEKGQKEKVKITAGHLSLFEHLAKILEVDKLKIIPTGGNIYQREREQWNDANNVLAIRPGVVIGYERNVHTAEKMREAGIHVLTIPGEELGRGRGGARCMSCPIERDDI
ncbi:MAG: arginine deiminase [Legionellales bacterium]|nr:arginine deiminase [Legionellales bacterium]